jgi:hypothetical protein
MMNPMESPMQSFRAFDTSMGESLQKSMLHQMERFWEGQRRLLDEYETLSRALLERRRKATEATLDLVRKMSTASNGDEWAKCCTDWVKDSFTRIAEDSRDMIAEGFKMLTEVSETVSANMAETAQASAETQKAVVRSASAQAEALGAASAQEGARIAAQRLKRPGEGARA